jgi:secreted PhoX family phosphatase
MEVVMKKIHTRGSTQVSRRMLVVGAAAASAASLLTESHAKATAKVSQASVRFTSVSNAGRNCRSCKLFLEPSSCVFVEGPTSPDGYCWIWRSRDA